MKKGLIIALALCLALSLFAGGQQAAKPKVIKIGTSKIVEHPALNAVEQGIQDELKDLGYTNIQFDLQNAAGDPNVAAQIANKFKFDKVDIAVGIATPTAIALATAIKDIPVVFTAVTDPVDAGLVDDLQKGKNNVTGVSDMTPVESQIRLLKEFADVKTLGHVYTAGEPNAVKLAEQAEAVCKSLGINFIATSVTNSGEVKQATESIIKKVDGIYISTDNNVVASLTSVIDVAMQAGKPIVTADPSSAEEMDVLAAYGFDYYGMGRFTGRLIDRILKGEKPADIPTQFMTRPEDLILLVNKDVAAKLGIVLPQALLDRASKIVENGKVITK